MSDPGRQLPSDLEVSDLPEDLEFADVDTAAAPPPRVEYRPIEYAQPPPASTFRDWLAGAQQVGQSALQAASDATRTLGKGVTYGAGPAGAAALIPERGSSAAQAASGSEQLAQGESEIPRTYAEGSAFNSALESIAADELAAEQRMGAAALPLELAGNVATSYVLTPALGALAKTAPAALPAAARVAAAAAKVPMLGSRGQMLAHGARAAGEAMAPRTAQQAILATIPQVPRAVQTAARVASTVAPNAALAGIGRWAAAPAGTSDEERARELGAGVGVAGLAGGAVEAALPVAGKLARAAAPKMSGLADYLRGKALGAMPGTSRATKDAAGHLGAISQLGAEAERRGMHRTPSGLPGGAATFAKNAQTLAEDAGTRMGAATAEMAAQGVRLPSATVMSRLRSVANSLPAVDKSQQLAKRRALSELQAIASGDLGRKEMLDPSDLLSLKQRLQGNVRWADLTSRVTPSKTVRGADTSAANESLDRSMRGQMYDLFEGRNPDWGGAADETASAFRKASEDYGAARKIYAAASDRAARTQGYVPLTASGLVGAATGAGGAVASGADTIDALKAGAAGAVLATGANRYGANLGASAARSAQRGLEQAPRLGPAIRRMPAVLGAHAAGDDDAADSDGMAQWLKSAVPSAKNSTQAITQLVDKAPEALGAYAEQLTAAKQQSPEHFEAALMRLQETDPEFQRLTRELSGER